MRTHPHFLWTNLFNKVKSEKTTLAEVLKKNALFCTLNSRELRYLTTLVYERIYQPDEPIFVQNDRGLGMYVINKGRIAIKTQGLTGEVLVTVLKEGSFLGEIALVDVDSIRTASAIAMERSVVAGFFKPDLNEIMERKPDMAVKILLQLSTVLGQRLLETTEKLTHLNRTQKELHAKGA